LASDRSLSEPTLADSSYSSGSYESDTSSSSSSTKDAAKEEAQNVKAAATDATQQVAGTAQEQAGKVVSDVRTQTKQLAEQTRTQVSSQVNDQRDRAVGGLRSIGDELRGMSNGEQTQASGLVAQLAGEGAELTHKVADFIEQREPAELIDEVRGFARRKPGTFLIGAAIAGVVVGRLTRGAVAARQEDSSGSNGSPQAQSLSSGYAYDTTPSTYGTDTSVPAYGTASMDQLAYPPSDIESTSDFSTEPGYRQ
jgi:uncharacterized protein YjbJ (UPF0337 family)